MTTREPPRKSPQRPHRDSQKTRLLTGRQQTVKHMCSVRDENKSEVSARVKARFNS